MMLVRWPRGQALTLSLALSLITALLLTAAGQVQAHRQHMNWTTITWNAESLQLEVEHRLHEHDAQLILGDLQYDMPNLVRTADRARVALYVAERFSLTLTDQDTASLELVGAELNGNMVFVYQTLSLEKIPAALTISTHILMDVHSDQINKVNIEFTRPTQTLTFNQQSSPEVAQIIN
ncbi:MAG: hypothetical protein ACJATP_000446 [Candidatus Azotimanducaceae bacterium]|jgi:hypothetical protein